MYSFRFIDLFAGLGGFHVALNRLGGQCVFAAEWKPHLQDLYEINHGLRPVGDITHVDPHGIPAHDVLTAGFPCQPFSKAGDQRGFDCTSQGGLFFNVEEILRAKKPYFFILENVSNLLKHNGGRTLKEIEYRLAALGYHIRYARLSPHNFGIPQIRERIYIVGCLSPLDRFKWPELRNQPTSIEDVLDPNPNEAKRLTTQVAECLEVWNEFLKRCPSYVDLPSFPLWSMEWGADYPFEEETPYSAYVRGGTRALAKMRGSHGVKLGSFRGEETRWSALPSHARDEVFRFPKWKRDFIRQNRQFYADNKCHFDPWLNSIVRFPSSLQKLEWNVKGGRRDIYDYVIQFRASGVRVKRRTTAPSLIAMTETQVPIIGWEKRYMTPRECARLQSLDTLSSLPASPTKAFHALGNAVNSTVVELVARALFTTCSLRRPNDVYREVSRIC
jgi:DNA (cytosine-5)-methyltransferase 1